MDPSQVYEFAFVCCSIAAVALLIWEHAITLGAEVQRIWARKLSGSTVLYACLRYGTLFEKIAVLFLASWYLTPRSCRCDIAVRVQILPMIIRTIGFGLFSSLRVFALSDRNWRLAVPVFLLCIPSAVAPAYVYAHQEAGAVNGYGCQLAYLASAKLHDRLRIVGIIADILSETIVIVVTISRTFWLREVPVEERRRAGVAVLLLRNGAIYFVALLVLSLADLLVLIFDHVPEFATRYDYWVVPYYTPVFRTILICRFLLMLRAVYYDDTPGNTADPDATHTGASAGEPIYFASRVIGPLGAPVDASRFDDDDFDEGEEEDVVYAGDPLLAGLALMDAGEGEGKGESKAKDIELQDLSSHASGSDQSSGSGVGV